MWGASQVWMEVQRVRAAHRIAIAPGGSERAVVTTVLFIIGLALVLLLVIDVHSTVFIPRGQPGLLSRRFYRASWLLWKRISERLPGSWRRIFLAQLGPMLVPLTVMVWGALLVIGFALMYAPWVGQFDISPVESGPMPRWALAFYYSGYSAVTLGVGDVVPNGTVPRVMAVIEAGLGFALFTVSITYLLSVYSARNESAGLSLAISRYVGSDEGDDPVSLLIGVAQSSATEGMGDWLGQIAFELATLVELRGQYPLLHFFHEPNDDRAVPIALSELMELITLCRAMLDPGEYPALADGPTVRAVERLGVHYLADFHWKDTRDEEVLCQRRRRHYDAARSRFEDAGMALRPDDQAWARFDQSMAKWDLADQHMREWLEYRPVDARLPDPEDDTD
jgi:hypothetical protein